MGFRFRKSINFGPVRINLSKSGTGVSVGGKGMRTGVKANGKSYTTYSIPGTGMSYTTEGKNANNKWGCLMLVIPALGGLLFGMVYLFFHVA